MQGIKHAVIRKDLKINKNSNTVSSQKSVKIEELGEKENEIKNEIGSGNIFCESEDYTVSDNYIFRCGKVGPCDSLSEVLL